MVYLKKKTLQEALLLLEETMEGLNLYPGPEDREMISTYKALGSITSSPVRASYPVPHYRAAAMDGIALKARESFGASRENPIFFNKGEVLPVDTGDPVPDAYNAIIMIEDTKKEGDLYRVYGPATPGQHIRPIGEDLEENEVVLPEGHVIRPEDMGALLSCGATEIEVKKRPTIAILPTGSELVSPGPRPGPGEVVEFNSQVISSLISTWGGDGVIVEKIKDDPLLLKKGILELAREYRVIVTIAGSSAGTEDYMAKVLEETGDLLLHGLSIRPGKPLIIGRVGSSLLLGLPGYPVSCYLDAYLFLRRIVYNLRGLPLPPLERVKALLGQDILSSYGVDEFVRVSLEEIQNELVAQPLSRGASIISSLVRGDGFLPIPRLQGGASAKDRVEIQLFTERGSKRHIFITGSYHSLLKTLRDSLLSSPEGVDLLFGGRRRGITGLKALKDGLSHMASLYLPWDPSTSSITREAQSSILQSLGRDEAYFLHLARVQEDREEEAISATPDDTLSYGLLYLEEDERVKRLLQVVRSRWFQESLEKGEYKGGMVEPLRREKHV